MRFEFCEKGRTEACWGMASARRDYRRYIGAIGASCEFVRQVHHHTPLFSLYKIASVRLKPFKLHFWLISPESSALNFGRGAHGPLAVRPPLVKLNIEANHFVSPAFLRACSVSVRHFRFHEMFAFKRLTFINKLRFNLPVPEGGSA